MTDPEPEREKKLWIIDPTIFSSRGKAKRTERYRDFLKAVLRPMAISLLLGYPLGLAVLGIVYGGLVFWIGLAGSFLLLGLTLWRLGYSRNFEAWNPNLPRQLAVLLLAFLAAGGFYIALFWLRAYTIPIFAGILALAFVASIAYKGRD